MRGVRWALPTKVICGACAGLSPLKWYAGRALGSSLNWLAMPSMSYPLLLTRHILTLPTPRKTFEILCDGFVTALFICTVLLGALFTSERVCVCVCVCVRVCVCVWGGGGGERERERERIIDQWGLCESFIIISVRNLWKHYLWVRTRSLSAYIARGTRPKNEAADRRQARRHLTLFQTKVSPANRHWRCSKLQPVPLIVTDVVPNYCQSR